MLDLGRCGMVVALSFVACAHAETTQHPPAALPTARRDSAGVTVSTSAGGLLVPGAERLIQERLIARGLLPRDHLTGTLDDATFAALQRFQQTAQLAATGFPSYETVERLGLPAARVFHGAHATH